MTNLSGANLNNGAAVGPQGEGKESPSTFPKYPAYKDSGVEWLGDVPGHWNISPLKFSASCNDTVLPDSTDGDYEIEYVEISDVNEISGITGSTSYKFADAPSRARRMLQDGDVLVSTVRTYLRAIAPVVAPPENLIASTGFAVVRPRKGILDGAFLGYMLRAEWWISEVIARSVGVSYPAINASDLIGLNVPVPAWHEQTQIARFLDHETARIDALIEEQQRLIELLKEKRQAVISHAVTKGLDPTVPMKDSGVEWLGEVPAHWEVTPLKHVVATPITDGPHETPDFIDEGVLFVSAEAVSSGRINFSKARYISRDDHLRYSRKYRPQKFDIYMVKSGATTGVTAIVETDDEFNIWSPLAVVRCKPQYSPYFVLFSMRSRNFQESVVVNWSFGTQQNIGMNVIENLPIACPPADEQKKIAAFITQESEKWDSLISEGVRAVHLLQERRSALISAAVTGKIDVRGWQPPTSTQAPKLEVAEAN